MKKSVKKICKNCGLYDPQEGVCGVTVIHEGQYLELRVRETDRCWWDRMEQELSAAEGEDVELPVREVRVQYDLDNRKVRVACPAAGDPG